MTIELNFNSVIMSPRIIQGFDNNSKLTHPDHPGNEIVRLQRFHPFRSLMVIYQLSNIQIKIPYGGITGIDLE